MAQWNKHKLWEKPLYPFRVPYQRGDDRQSFREIYIDVTISAPSFDQPGKTLSEVFDKILSEEFSGRKKLLVLDFGAGKLRNTIYFLEKGHKVHAVEFEELRESKHAKKLFDTASQYSNNLKKYIFPKDFLKSTTKFDLILLVNVLTVMPVPSERWMVLLYLHKCIKDDGMILWYSQHGDHDQKNRCTNENILGDGWFIGQTRKYKTFYKEYNVEEINNMLLSCGFSFHRSFPISNNQARLYKKKNNALLSRVLDSSIIENSNIIDPLMKTPENISPNVVLSDILEDGLGNDTVEAYIPNPENLSFGVLLKRCLEKIQPGRDDANDYETAIALILSHVFKGHLRNLKTQQDMNEGRKRIDFVMTNDSDHGFFRNLSDKHSLKCPYIIFECKNYTEDLQNGEIDQLLGRLKPSIGVVGFIVCRSIKNKTKVLK
jgi:2-polyprenyl-3-methyl-5-hydroxy-6-metoxy-1,4-benzoquinol methylase